MFGLIGSKTSSNFPFLRSETNPIRSQGIVQGKILTPRLFENVDATTERHIFQVKLKDSLFSSLLFAKAKDTEIAWVEGVLKEEKSLLNEDGDDSRMDEDDDDDDLLSTDMSIEERKEKRREEKMRKRNSGGGGGGGDSLDDSTASVAEKVPTLMPVSVAKGNVFSFAISF